MVVWIIGLSGSGKTTLAKEVYAQTRESLSNVVLLDGDTIRDMFDNDLGQQKAGMAIMVWHMNGYNLNQRTFLYKIKSSY